MDDRRVGAVFRELRRRKHWRQRDVAGRAGVSQQLVSLLEVGAFEEVGLGKARAVAKALDATIEPTPRWRGPELDRLLDGAHAALVEQVVDALRRAGWEVIVEWTFSHFGERGSADIVGWHAASSSLLVIEAKTRIVDLQALLASDDRKARLAAKLLPQERGWRPQAVSRLLVLPATSTARDALRRHAAIVGATYPARTLAVRRWIRSPHGSIAGIWLVQSTSAPGTARAGQRVGRSGVARPRSR